MQVSGPGLLLSASPLCFGSSTQYHHQLLQPSNRVGPSVFCFLIPLLNIHLSQCPNVRPTFSLRERMAPTSALDSTRALGAPSSYPMPASSRNHLQIHRFVTWLVLVHPHSHPLSFLLCFATGLFVRVTIVQYYSPTTQSRLSPRDTAPNLAFRHRGTSFVLPT